jgi:ABC-type transporter Mla subunit MlaD
VLHKRWVELEDEHHQLATAIDAARARRADLAPMRERQARLLLEINSLVAEIRDAPATTIEDFCALLDVALEHEVDLACDIAFYGPADFPMIRRLLSALAHKVPEFEFNSLRRWLSPGQFEQLMDGATRLEAAGNDAAPVEPSSFVTAIHDSARKRG